MYLAFVMLAAFLTGSTVLVTSPYGQRDELTGRRHAAQLAVGFSHKVQYHLMADCDVTKPIVVLNVLLRNSGTLASVAKPGNTGIVATDSAGTLSGGVPLPSVAPDESMGIAVPLRAVGSTTAAALVGAHSLVVSVGALHSAPLVVEIPATLCGH